MKNLLNVANFITFLGIILAIWVNTLVFSSPELIWVVVALVLLVGLTDFLDGYLARKYKIQTQIGSFLDRLRDKIFICPLLVILVLYRPLKFYNGLVFPLLKALVYATLLIEGVLIISWIVGVSKRMDLSSNKYGKRKMALQFLAVLIWVFYLGLEKHAKNFFLMGLSYLAVLILLISVIYGFLSVREYLERYF